MGISPLVAALGLALLLRVGARPDYVTGLLLALLLFSLGLAATVAPLTATVLADADDSDAWAGQRRGREAGSGRANGSASGSAIRESTLSWGFEGVGRSSRGGTAGRGWAPCA
jgi:hypothetical protein